jgi:hypothetical protein
MFALKRYVPASARTVLSWSRGLSSERPTQSLLAFKNNQLRDGMARLWEFVATDPIKPISPDIKLDMANIDKPRMAAFDVAIRSFARHPFVTVLADDSGLTPTVLPGSTTEVITCFTDPDGDQLFPAKQFTGAEILNVAISSIHSSGTDRKPVGISIDDYYIPLDMAMISPAMNTYMLQLLFEEVLQKKKVAMSIIPAITDKEEQKALAQRLMQTPFIRGPDHVEKVGKDDRVYATVYSSSGAYYAMCNEWTGEDQNYLGQHIEKMLSFGPDGGELFAGIGVGYEGIIIDPLLTSDTDAQNEANLVLDGADIQKLANILKKVEEP